MTEPKIKNLEEKKLIGKKLTMSLANNRTVDLWKSFMPHKKEIKKMISSDLFSVQVYDSSLDFSSFSPTTAFQKWAAVEVSAFDQIPENMETLVLPSGLYAVFLYQGDPREFAPAFRFIFGEWIPNSEYELDNRPHFEIMGEKYKNDSPDSEEEIWIPIRKK